MGTVFRKQVTRSIPPGAEIITRKDKKIARWRGGRRKMRA